MPKDISIKEFRNNLAKYASLAEAGQAFRVIRRSKPSFIVMNIDSDMDKDGLWETVIDFTEEGKKDGISAGDLIETIDSICNDDE
ncbi:hypothetical protein KJ652_00310 [Patescibacteria group bacterium]|nr:hypothetical protein [Patescibacteria group bacterium]MBU1123016.1 hypothetical protein [Patescibacteria group bacterium]MBU1911734.1 hypothetical protein [Patescibacteria group bacterium]